MSTSWSSAAPPNPTEGPVCYCGLVCPMIRAKTTNNFGRAYYGCPRWREPNGCTFFRWVDSSSESSEVSRFSGLQRLDELKQKLEAALEREKHVNAEVEIIRKERKILCFIMVVSWVFGAFVFMFTLVYSGLHCRSFP
ncbi:uncharacterized protein LOC113866632 [Abrus precatorius]|uniref:Uncharacterized protein LOC113866632 n=1 Tax=Abrus precatorius TaxID=3816 RepID=A0A8B8LPB2_ABRPR|nr:uncharacterized protein LOC113866632 [Abrus precatorius]